MTEPDTARALAQLSTDWDETRTERALAGARRRIVRARRGRRVVAVAAVAMVAAVVWLVLPARSPVVVPVAPVAASPEQPRRVRFLDGSVIDLLGEGSDVRVRSVTDARIEVELAQGRGRFDVTPNPQRGFVVHAGSVTVEVVGTEFVVEKRGARSFIEVQRGKVRVSWADNQVLLEPGGKGLFPLEGTTQTAAPAPSARPPDAAERFRARARDRDYAGAYQLLVSNPAVVSGSAADLMLAADVARLSGHVEAAIPYLERVIREHASSAQAPLAAFTLGRVLASLGRTAQASEAFAKVTALAPSSPLAEDALARRIEGASRAGDRQTARRLAEQYLATYPTGRRRDAVRRLGGLE